MTTKAFTGRKPYRVLTPEERHKLATDPLPPVRGGGYIPGKSWAGVLIPDPVCLDYEAYRELDAATVQLVRDLISKGEHAWLETYARQVEWTVDGPVVVKL